MSQIPNCDHLIGKRVLLKLNPWAMSGPNKGIFAGQGERGLTIAVEGGGQFVRPHHEIAGIVEIGHDSDPCAGGHDEIALIATDTREHLGVVCRRCHRGKLRTLAAERQGPGVIDIEAVEVREETLT